MSLAIDIDKVVMVLLADGWHHVKNHSFELDAYEYTYDGDLLHGGGQYDVCATGFEFLEKVEHLPDMLTAGPLTAILAVRHEVSK